jgi:hypothetical protein
MHGLYEVNNIRLGHTRSHLLSPSMLVTHVNVRYMENLCQHQIAILLTYTNFIKIYIIQYCVTLTHPQAPY